MNLMSPNKPINEGIQRLFQNLQSDMSIVRKMKYSINGKIAQLEISGEARPGKDLCLLDRDDDLTQDCSWQNQGFFVAPMLERELFDALHRGVGNFLREALMKSGCEVEDDEFSLERYHEYCPDQKKHLEVIEFLRRRASIENFPIDRCILDEMASKLCGKAVSCKVDNLIAAGYFFIRLVRPAPYRDNNPPHKDAWLDHLRNGLNLYLPLAGSDENSSLSLLPGSHFWKESVIPRSETDAKVNGVNYSVPSVVMADGALKMLRPEVKLGEGMLFSPYLIHGGAVNFNTDKTRVSLEMRFWRCKQ